MTKLRTKGVHTYNHVDARLQLMRNTHQHIVHVHIRAVEQQLYSNPWKYHLFFSKEEDKCNKMLEFKIIFFLSSVQDV